MKCVSFCRFLLDLRIITALFSSEKPLLSATAKVVFSCFQGKKQANSIENKQNRASERSIGCPGARFFVFRPRKRSKTPVYFLRFLALQRTPKRVEGEGFEYLFWCDVPNKSPRKATHRRFLGIFLFQKSGPKPGNFAFDPCLTHTGIFTENQRGFSGRR